MAQRTSFRSVAKQYAGSRLPHTMGLMTTTRPRNRLSRIPPPQAPRTTYRAVFAVAEFRVLFAAFGMYVLGFEFEILGLSVLVYAQTRSPFLTALAFSLGFAPQAVGGALFSSLADRLPPRLVIGSGLLIRAVPGLAIGVLPGLPIPVMLALVAAAATVAPVFSAASSGLLPDVLDGDRYVLGRSIFNLTGSGTQIIGLGIAGAILAVVPARWLLLAAGLALTAAAVVSRLGLRRREARPPPPQAPAGRAARPRGHPRHHRRQRRIVLRPAHPWPSARPVAAGLARGRSRIADRPLHRVAGPPRQRRGAAAGGGAGGDAARRGDRLPVPAAGHPPRLAFPLAVGIGLPLLAFWLQPPLPAAVAVLLVSGLGFAYQLGLQQAFLDSLPERLRGQAFGLYSTGAMGGQGLGPVAAGALASAVAPGPVIAMAGAGHRHGAGPARHAARMTPAPGWTRY